MLNNIVTGDSERNTVEEDYQGMEEEQTGVEGYLYPVLVAALVAS